MTNKTIGHTASQPGLRGHSVDADTYPWRVVAGYWRDSKGDLQPRWFVEGHEGVCEVEYRAGAHRLDNARACQLAHRAARAYRRQYPSGRVSDEANFEDPILLDGCYVTVQIGGRTHREGVIRYDSRHDVLSIDGYGMKAYQRGVKVGVDRLRNPVFARLAVHAAPQDVDVVRADVETQRKDQE